MKNQLLRPFVETSELPADDLVGRMEQLTTREIQVLQLVAGGKANKQTASELSISIKTVEKHRENIGRKTGIHGTVGLTHFAIFIGIVQCNPHLAAA
jgi:DNA-binding NarL/FixJ family response regulator